MVKANTSGQIEFTTAVIQSDEVLEACAELEDCVKQRASPEVQAAQSLVNKLSKRTRDAKNGIVSALVNELGADEEELPELEKPTKFLVNESLILEARIHTRPKSSSAAKRSLKMSVRQHDMSKDADDFSITSSSSV